MGSENGLLSFSFAGLSTWLDFGPLHCGLEAIANGFCPCRLNIKSGHEYGVMRIDERPVQVE